MSHGRKQRQALVVKRMFEPGRLSTTWLAEAYAQVVPRHLRVIQAPVRQAEERDPQRRPQAGGQTR